LGPALLLGHQTAAADGLRRERPGPCGRAAQNAAVSRRQGRARDIGQRQPVHCDPRSAEENAMRPVSPRERRLVSLGILVILVAIVWLGLISPILGGFWDRAEERHA